MHETTTLRDMAYVLSVNEPDATSEEHLSGLIEVAQDTHLRDLVNGPESTLTEREADFLLQAYQAEFGDVDDQADRDRADLGDPDWAYEAYLESTFEG